jgi:hypothetical protein
MVNERAAVPAKVPISKENKVILCNYPAILSLASYKKNSYTINI